MTTLVLPTSYDPFVADAVAARLSETLDIVVDVRFDSKASGIEIDPLPESVAPADILREARLGLELAEAARLFRVDGEDRCIVYVRVARVRDFGATDAERALFHALLDDVVALWVAASGFAGAEVRILAGGAGEGMTDVRPTVIPAAESAADSRSLLEQAGDYDVCADAEDALLALERMVWGEVASMQAAA